MTSPLALVADTEPVCADCLAHDGLCRIHAREVCPAPLRTNYPVWLIGYTYAKPEPESPKARRVRERKERKRSGMARLARAVGGEFSRSVKSAA